MTGVQTCALPIYKKKDDQNKPPENQAKPELELKIPSFNEETHHCDTVDNSEALEDRLNKITNNFDILLNDSNLFLTKLAEGN